MNRETKTRLRAIRDNLIGIVEEMYEMFPEEEKKKKEPIEVVISSKGEKKEVILEPLPDANVTWETTTDDTPKEGIYMKDLNEATDLKDMSIIGQITSIGDTETWHSERLKTSGFVKNWVLGDSSGEIVVVFWDKQIEKVKDFMLGTNVKITNAWQVKKNRQGILELHPGKYFNIERVE